MNKTYKRLMLTALLVILAVFAWTQRSVALTFITTRQALTSGTPTTVPAAQSNGSSDSFARVDHTHNCTLATGSVSGCLSSTNWTTFNNKAATGTCTNQFMRSTTSSGVTCNYVNLASGTDITGTLPYNYGGTGNNSTFAQGGVAYGTSTSVIDTNTAGTAGASQFLMSNGTSAPTWVTSVRRASISSNVSTSATTNSQVMSFVVPGAITGFSCVLPSYGTTTSSPRFTLTISSYAPFVQQWTKWTTSNTTPVYETFNGNSQTAGCTSGCQANWGVWKVEGQVNTTAGLTMYLYVASSTSGQTVNVQAGAFCLYW